MHREIPTDGAREALLTSNYRARAILASAVAIAVAKIGGGTRVRELLSMSSLISESRSYNCNARGRSLLAFSR